MRFSVYSCADRLCGPGVSNSTRQRVGGRSTPEERGLWNLQHNAYGAPLFNKKLLESLVKVWEPEWKAKINGDDPDSIRKVAFETLRFFRSTWTTGAGLCSSSFSQTELWTQTCMLCHGGRVPITGESKIGMPNTELDMQTLYSDILNLTRIKPPFQLTFGMSRGRTKRVHLSLELLRRRNEDLSPRKEPLPMGDTPISTSMRRPGGI